MSLRPTPALPNLAGFPPSPAALGRPTNWRLLIGAAIVFAGFALRIVGLGGPSFWWDDSYSTMVAASGLHDIVATLAREDFHPPLHYFILHYWLRVVGTSEFALRYLSVGAGALAIAAGWTTARRLFGRLAAPIAAGLFAASPFLWYYSQEARMFALVPLLGSLALYFCARAADDNRRRSWIGYVVVCTLGVYDFYYFDFVPLACGVWLFLDGSRATARRGWLVATVAVGLIYLPWLPIFLARGSAWSNGSPSLASPIKIVVWSWPAFVLGLPTLSLYGETVPAILLGLGGVVTVTALFWSFDIHPLRYVIQFVPRRSTPRLPLPLGEGWGEGRTHVPSTTTFPPIAAPFSQSGSLSPLGEGQGEGIHRPTHSHPAQSEGGGDRVRPSPSPSPRGRGKHFDPAIAHDAPAEGNARLAALAVVVPLAAMAAVAAVKPVFHPRYAIPVESGLLLLLAGFVAYLVRFSGPRRIAGILVGVLLISCSAYGLVRLRTDGNYARDDYRSAIGFVSANEQPGDTIIHNAVPPFWYYYHGPSPTTYFPTGPYTEADVAAALNSVTRGRARLWYVTQSATPSDPDGFVDAELRLHATRLIDHRYGALRVQLWQIPGNDAFVGPTFQPMTANLANELAITGFAANGDPIGGHPLDVELRLQTIRTPSADDGFWVALVDGAGNEWGRVDAQPLDAAYLPSSRWPAGRTVIVRSDVPIAVGTPPGTYDLVAGAYRLRDLVGLDLLAPNGTRTGQRVRLGTVTVARPSDGETDPTLGDQAQRTVGPGLVLAGDRVGATEVHPGDKVPVTLLWRATGRLAALDASLELLDAGGAAVAHTDGPIGGAFPTTNWIAGHPVREQQVVTVPATFPGKSLQVVLVSGTAPPVVLGALVVSQVTRDFTPPTSAHSVDATFGGQIGLVGFDLSANQITAGDHVAITLDWHALRAPATDYHVFVHLLDAQGQLVTQQDGVPKNWTYPTSAWVPNEYVVDQYSVVVPADTPAGPLTIETGLYDPTSGLRLVVASATSGQSADHVVLATLQVTK